jgi:hypothetical protein
MSNTIYLVCVHHPDKADAFVLAERADLMGYTHFLDQGGKMLPRFMQSQADRLAKFFKRHKHCGRGCDHFTIAFDQAKDWDIPKPETLAEAVHAHLQVAANEPATDG